MTRVIRYTVPNLATMEQRGSIMTRTKTLLSLNQALSRCAFELVEVPGDFVKNASEETRAGLPVGSMLLDRATAEALYSDEPGDPTAPAAGYILHTEPSLPRRGTRRVTPALRWYDRDWVNLFIRQISTIVDCLGRPPYAVELHPGFSQRGQNTIMAVADGICRVHGELSDKYGSPVQVFIENRTGQVMRTGSQMREMWVCLTGRHAPLEKVCGFVVDLQQLYTSTRAQFLSELAEVPAESIAGYHIHRLHRTPGVDDPIPWREAAGIIARGWRPLHILPEVHHWEQLLVTYGFCKEVLGL